LRERYGSRFSLDSSRKRPPANHPPNIRLEQGISGQLARSASSRAEERPFPVLGYAGCLDVLLKVAIEIVVRRHLMLLAALFMEPIKDIVMRYLKF